MLESDYVETRHMGHGGRQRHMSDALRFTVHYSDGGDGWIMAQVEGVPGAISQGRNRAEARENVTDALRLMLTPAPAKNADPDRGARSWDRAP